MQIKNTKQAAQHGVKCLVYGQSGAGKTRLCSTVEAPLIISAEAGLLSLRDQDLPYVEVNNMDQLREVYSFVTSSKEADQFNWIMLDSISEIAEVVLAAEKAKSRDPRKAYGELQDQMTSLMRSFRDLPRNVYMSAKCERVQDDSGALMFQPSMPGNKLAQQIPYLFDEVFALRVHKNEDGKISRALQTASDGTYTAKDRSGALETYESADLGAIYRKIRG
tara:strand:- start:1608 stop:2270 length:663 start_codon:yes stop_codon:yes gene_type:complete